MLKWDRWNHQHQDWYATDQLVICHIPLHGAISAVKKEDGSLVDITLGTLYRLIASDNTCRSASASEAAWAATILTADNLGCDLHFNDDCPH